MYQVRGTDPKADLYREVVSCMHEKQREEIIRKMESYCRIFGSDEELQSILRGHVYQQGFTKYVLWCFLMEQEEKNDGYVDRLDYELYERCEVEHILPQDRDKFDVTTCGFSSVDKYEEVNGTFGNLTLLERELNKRARNRPPKEKARIYAESKLRGNRLLGKSMREKGWTSEDVEKRLEEIVDFFRRTWPVPQ